MTSNTRKMSIFSEIQNEKLDSNQFNLTHDKKLTTQFGRLTPCFLMDCVPGDQINVKTNLMIRMAPLTAPVMHRVRAYVHFFFVPNRLVWDQWENFITAGEDGTAAPSWPYIELNLNASTNPKSGLLDYLGVPARSEVENNWIREVSAIPAAAYNLIYNEFYRDQNLQDRIPDQLSSGENTHAHYRDTQQRAWQHDYFTSALPFVQKGPGAMIPFAIDDQADIVLKEEPGRQIIFDQGNGLPTISVSPQNLEARGSSGDNALNTGTRDVVLDVSDSHEVDLADSISVASIVDLRRAFKLQEFLEKQARGGSRHVEFLQVHFNVRSDDARLQRPEFLGGSSTPVKISEVLQTSESNDSVTPQGNVAGYGMGIGTAKPNKTYNVKEFGYMMGILSIMPEGSYQQGIPRHLLRSDRFDYYFPSFAHIGEQAIWNDEVKVDGTKTQGRETWGYIPRYSEYKFIPNTVHGDFRNTLDFWHLGRKFNDLPALNDDFITMKPEEVNRIFAVQDESDNLWCQVLNETKARRKMPVFGNPKL